MSLLRAWLTKLTTFDGWMAISEVIDSSRAFPRFVLIYVVTFVAYDMLRLQQFFFDLPSADKAQGSVVAFVSAITAIDAMMLTAAFALYNASGRDWAAYHNERKVIVSQP